MVGAGYTLVCCTRYQLSSSICTVCVSTCVQEKVMTPTQQLSPDDLLGSESVVTMPHSLRVIEVLLFITLVSVLNHSHSCFLW